MLYETSEYIRNIPFYVGCTAQEAPEMLGLITKCRRPSGLAPTASCFSPGGFSGGSLEVLKNQGPVCRSPIIGVVRVTALQLPWLSSVS